MKETQMHVLLVDNDPANRCLFQVAQAELGSIRCDLTRADRLGLCNRRGFFLLADHQLRMARRSKTSLLLLFVDLDGLKQINDTLGHREGDLALSRAAEILCTTFRASDVVGRLGGDEFAVLTWEDSGQSAEAVVTRLLRRVEKSNATGSCQHVLSISVGVARFDPTRVSSLEELIAQADVALYGQKRSKYHAKPQPTQTTSQAPVPCTANRL